VTFKAGVKKAEFKNHNFRHKYREKGAIYSGTRMFAIISCGLQKWL